MGLRYFNGDRQLAKVGYFTDSKTLTGFFDVSDLRFVQGEGWTGYVPVERTINYKSNPSRHECDARCMNAKGRTMNCECSCEGKNHGRGFIAEAV